MKKLLLAILAATLFTSACATTRVTTRQDNLMNRCNTDKGTVGTRPTEGSCSDTSAGT